MGVVFIFYVVELLLFFLILYFYFRKEGKEKSRKVFQFYFFFWGKYVFLEVLFNEIFIKYINWYSVGLVWILK